MLWQRAAIYGNDPAPPDGPFPRITETIRNLPAAARRRERRLARVALEQLHIKGILERLYRVTGHRLRAPQLPCSTRP